MVQCLGNNNCVRSHSPRDFNLCSKFIGVLGQVQLEPLEARALRGSDVLFNATVTEKWEIMSWDVRGHQIMTVFSKGEIITTEPQFSATICPGVEPRWVEFTIHNVNRSDAGLVVCTVQGFAFTPKTAQLIVQENGTVNTLGGNQKVVEGQQVEFQCLTTDWFPAAEVTWTRNGQKVNESLYNTSRVEHGDKFNSTSVLKFQAVRNTTVACLASLSSLTHPQSSSVYLVVVPKPPDWTVLIAVVVSYGSFALLALLIIGIIFYRRKKKKGKSATL
ncbi:immunoglobulin superfamily member 5 [Genypterus blacodes]|uniref:immunoglobulin superfamily member 5 n=1 Tax=Genypterus blacodes TaxID=154954 RepID=UPI003F770EF8